MSLRVISSLLKIPNCLGINRIYRYTCKKTDPTTLLGAIVSITLFFIFVAMDNLHRQPRQRAKRSTPPDHPSLDTIHSRTLTQYEDHEDLNNRLHQNLARCHGVTSETIEHFLNIRKQSTTNFSSSRIIYNRVPKAGSTAVNTIIKQISLQGRFKVLHSENFGDHNINGKQQRKIIDHISAVKAPMVYDRHMHYFDPKKFGTDNVFWINVVREPVSRYISNYYFQRYGAITIGKANQADKRDITLDKCIQKNLDGCRLQTNQMILFFCGNSPECNTNPRHSIQIAKRRVERDFVIVGLDDDLVSFFKILELAMPSFFSGSADLYVKNDEKMRKNYSTLKKFPPTNRTLEVLTRKFKHDIEFYQYMRAYFNNRKCLLLNS